MDDGFWYEIPEHLRDDVTIGARVRVPLGGRRVRGFVVELDERPTTKKLKEVAGVSGEIPIFGKTHLESLRWAARHYVAPLSVVLERAAPPTLPKLKSSEVATELPEIGDHPLGEFLSEVAREKRRPMVAYVSQHSDLSWLRQIRVILEAGRSVMIVVATVKEAESLAGEARAQLGDWAILIPDGDDSVVTRAWEDANDGPKLVVGTPRLASWSVSRLGLAVVVEDGRRAMKDRQTPTIHVRDLLRARSRIEGFALCFVGPTPSVEVIAGGAEVVRGRRPWGLIEVVDRTDDPPGSGFLSEQSIAALKSVVQRGGSAFVFTHRRAENASARCTSCRALRRCGRCGSNVGQRENCRRCGEAAGQCLSCGGRQFESMGSIPARIVSEIATRVGKDEVGGVDAERAVVVGTERDLAGLGGFEVAVVADVDALVYGQDYRSSEEALRIVARVAGLTSRASGNRTLIQTSNPQSALVATMRRGDPIPYLESVLAERVRDGFPPATEMMAIEVRNQSPEKATAAFARLFGGMVMGPAESTRGYRWLIQGDLGPHKRALRKEVQILRDSGATVRVDVDPIDL